jgi:hypothetical protein
VIAIAALAAGLVLDGAVRSEARAGTPAGGVNPDAVMLGADLGGRASTPDGEVRFAISPSGTLGQTNQAIVRGLLQGELRQGGVTVRAVQRGGYGTVDLSGLTPAAAAEPGAPPPVPSAPAARFATVQESNSSLELNVLADRRTTVTARAGWTVSGGADAASRTALPLARGPSGRAQLEWAASEVDLLRLDVSGFETTFSNGLSAAVAGATAGWQSRLTRDWRLTLSAGPGLGRASGAGTPARTRAYPLATAVTSWAAAPSFTVDAGALVQPLGDPASGDLIERGAAWLAARWGGSQEISLGGRLTSSVTLTSGSGGPTSPRAGDRLLQGEVSALLPLDRADAFVLGGRVTLANRPLEGQPKQAWAAFIGFRTAFTTVP